MDPIIYLQLRVGTTAGQPKHLRRHLTVRRIHNLVRRHFQNFTRINAVGQWSNQREAGALIDTITVIDPTSCEQILDLCQGTHSAIEALLKEMPQWSILVLVRVSIEGRETSWMRLVSWDGDHLIDPPFPFTSLLVRKLASKANLALPRLYRIMSETGIDGVPDTVKVFSQVPAFCFRTNSVAPLRFTGGRDFQRSCTRWDQQLLTLADRPPFSDDNIRAKCSRNSDYIGLFQRVSLGERVYFATDISRVLSGPPISVAECSYYHGAGCCEAANLDLLDRWLGHKFDESGMRKDLDKELSLSRLYQTPLPMVGMEVLTVTPEGCILRKRRSEDVCALPGAYGFVPSGMVEPIPGCNTASVCTSFMRELDEEMFRGSLTGETLSSLLSKPHLRDLRGTLACLGHCFLLLNRFVVMCLVFKPSEGWWKKYKGEIHLNWEYANGAVEVVPIDQAWEDARREPWAYTPGAYATLKFEMEDRNASTKVQRRKRRHR